MSEVLLERAISAYHESREAAQMYSDLALKSDSPVWKHRYETWMWDHIAVCNRQMRELPRILRFYEQFR